MGNVLVVFLFVLIWSLCAEKIVAGSRVEEQHLVKLKTIKSPDGDTIECVHVSQQPAFDDPLLKDHIIQLTPSNHPKGLLDERKKLTTSPNIAQLWHQNGRCPKGTIPIQRSEKKIGKKHRRSNPLIPSSTNDTRFQDHEHAYGYVGKDKYYGTKVKINLWQPLVEQLNEFSLAQLWIVGYNSSSATDINTIEVGWQVFPYLYGDNNTRLFIYWTRDGYNATGCYNLLCPGFIQTNNAIAFGATIPPVSTYDGSQHEITVLVWKDAKSGNWWLQIDDNLMGYWPSSIFTYLSSASTIEWGGEIINSKQNGKHTTTQMGSGHFAKEGFHKAGYFRNIEIVNASNYLNIPLQIYNASEQPNCYTIQTGYDPSQWGQYFFYGGPGRNPNCP